MTSDNPMGKFDGLCIKNINKQSSDARGWYEKNSMNNIIDKIVCYFKIEEC